jgi:hypothetical protein
LKPVAREETPMHLSRSTARLAGGEPTPCFDFAYARGSLGKGGTGALFVDGGEGTEGRIQHTRTMLLSADDVGASGSGRRSRFTARSVGRWTE